MMGIPLFREVAYAAYVRKSNPGKLELCLNPLLHDMRLVTLLAKY